MMAVFIKGSLLVTIAWIINVPTKTRGINMEIDKPKKKNTSLKNVTWGSEEFYKLMKQADKEKEQSEQYEREIEAIKTIQGY